MDIRAFVNGKEVGKLFEGAEREYVFEYFPTVRAEDSVALSMPSLRAIYISKYHLHPFFDSFLPEGYLFEVLKDIISKREGRADDFTMFYYLASGIEGRVSFEGREKPNEVAVSLEEILENDTWDTFRRLLSIFLYKNAISGVQPKTIAVVKGKTGIELREFIVKTFGEEYPHLAENEYFCMRAVERAGIPVPRIYLSENKRFLVVGKFTYGEDGYLGFEEIGSILGRSRRDKYEGSYEQIAKAIKRFSTDMHKDLETYYKMTVMNFLLKNGDAHNKNFGFLYSPDLARIWLAPAYDVVCTTVYIRDDKPALFLKGTKKWLGERDLEEFGVKYCGLEKERAKELFNRCREAIAETMREVQAYIKDNPEFKEIGNRLIAEWDKSLKLSTPLNLNLNIESSPENSP